MASDCQESSPSPAEHQYDAEPEARPKPSRTRAEHDAGPEGRPKLSPSPAPGPRAGLAVVVAPRQVGNARGCRTYAGRWKTRSPCSSWDGGWTCRTAEYSAAAVDRQSYDLQPSLTCFDWDGGRGLLTCDNS